MPVLLAQAGARGALNEMLPWLGALLVAALVGGALLFYLRHRLLGPDAADTPGRGFMEELRDLRDRGEISEDEFETARLSIIAKATGKDLQTLRDDAIRKAGGKVARPGYDLTGRPLPAQPDAARPDSPVTGPRKPDAGNAPERGPGPHDPPAE